MNVDKLIFFITRIQFCRIKHTQIESSVDTKSLNELDKQKSFNLQVREKSKKLYCLKFNSNRITSGHKLWINSGSTAFSFCPANGYINHYYLQKTIDLTINDT